jgi:SAM-dependent methyltransferase/uncharacterized protein YbaR (Trm112 family)
MRASFVHDLRCPECAGVLSLETFDGSGGEGGDGVQAGALRSGCGRAFPVIAGIPRLLPGDLAATLPARFPDFFAAHPDLSPSSAPNPRPRSLATARAFGDEWQRFPELFEAHREIFDWYFEGGVVGWHGRRALDAGCGMGRWLHFAAERGARVVGMDASAAIEVAAARDGHRADFVQADLRQPPFAPGSFDLVYSLGVVHHLEDPVEGVRVLSHFVRPGGELRLYVYRSLEGEHLLRRGLLRAVTAVRRVTTRLPYPALHAFSWMVAAVASVAVLWPRRLARQRSWGERLTRGLPLVQYTDVPFGMLVAEQFDRFAAPIEVRCTREQVESWIEMIGFERVAVLAGLGWRAVARRQRETSEQEPRVAATSIGGAALRTGGLLSDDGRPPKR